MSSSTDMIEQLQHLLESDATIPQNVTNGLVFAAMRVVYQEVKGLEGDISKIPDVKMIVESFEEEAKSRGETLKNLDESIRGNGRTGLNQRISTIEKWVENQIWFQRLLIGMIVAEMIAMIWHVFIP